MTNLRKLNWTSKGYIPESYEWFNYSPSTNPYVIRHDLLNHQPNESGTDLEEFRALGARHWFEPKHTIFTVQIFKNWMENFDIVSSEFSGKLKPEVEEFKGLKTEFSLYARGNISEHQISYLVGVLQDGFIYAQQFKKTVWTKLLEVDFPTYHRNGYNVVFNLTTGKIHKLLPPKGVDN